MSETTQQPGAMLHSDDAEARRLAASLMGRARTEKKREASASNIAQVNERKRTEGVSEEYRAKLREAQAARRKREQAEKAALGVVETPEPKRPRGRPKKEASNA